MSNPKDPDLTDEQNASLDKFIDELVADGWSRNQAEEAAPIMLGLSDGDVIELEEE